MDVCGQNWQQQKRTQQGWPLVWVGLHKDWASSEAPYLERDRVRLLQRGLHLHVLVSHLTGDMNQYRRTGGVSEGPQQQHR